MNTSVVLLLSWYRHSIPLFCYSFKRLPISVDTDVKFSYAVGLGCRGARCIERLLRNLEEFCALDLETMAATAAFYEQHNK